MKKERLQVSSDNLNAFLGEGTSFKGNLTFEGTVRVDGKLEGEIFTKDTLVVGESATVKAAIHAGMMRRARAGNRGVKFARYYVIRHAKNPSVLVECGFVSNYRERARMKKSSWRDGMARGIAEGIAKYQSERRAGRAS